MGIEQTVKALATERDLLREVACLAWASSDAYTPVCMTAQHKLVERDHVDGEHLYNIRFAVAWPGEAVTPLVSCTYQIGDGNERLDKGARIGVRVHDWMTCHEQKLREDFRLLANRTRSIDVLYITAQPLRYTTDTAAALFRKVNMDVSRADINNWLERNKRKPATQPILAPCDLFK